MQPRLMDVKTCNEPYLEATLFWSFNFLSFQLQITSGIKKQFLPDVIPRNKAMKDFSFETLLMIFFLATPHLEKADEGWYLIAIIVSVLAALSFW